MGSLGEMLGAAFDAAQKREYMLTKIRTWLEHNDHMLPDGGEDLWKILDGED